MTKICTSQNANELLATSGSLLSMETGTSNWVGLLYFVSGNGEITSVIFFLWKWGHTTVWFLSVQTGTSQQFGFCLWIWGPALLSILHICVRQIWIKPCKLGMYLKSNPDFQECIFTSNFNILWPFKKWGHPHFPVRPQLIGTNPCVYPQFQHHTSAQRQTSVDSAPKKSALTGPYGGPCRWGQSRYRLGRSQNKRHWNQQQKETHKGINMD